MVIDDARAGQASRSAPLRASHFSPRVMEAMLQPRYCRPPTPCRTTDTHNLIHHGATDAALRPLPFCSTRSHRRSTSPIKMHRAPQETERNAYRRAESKTRSTSALRHATRSGDVLIAPTTASDPPLSDQFSLSFRSLEKFANLPHPVYTDTLYITRNFIPTKTVYLGYSRNKLEIYRRVVHGSMDPRVRTIFDYRSSVTKEQLVEGLIEGLRGNGSLGQCIISSRPRSIVTLRKASSSRDDGAEFAA